MHHLLHLQLFLVMRTPAPVGSSGSMRWNCIHTLTKATSQSSPTRTQDKGQKNAISYYLKSVGHFHCSYHRQQNIIKMCRGGGGKLPNSALYVYNKLMKCRSVALIEHFKEQHFKNMNTKDIQYLNSLDDESQYPAARCAMGAYVYLYFCSSSGTAESMNKANKEMRARTAVDLLNACMLLIKLECKRFYKMKKDAWGGTTVLTPRGIEEYEATFTNLSPSHFIFNLRDFDDHIEMRVQRINVTGLTLPKYPVNGSHFGTCTCRADKTNAVPCEHMAAIALSSVIRPPITPINVMPMWWKRKQWQLQFPLDLYSDANITMKSVKEGRLPDFICACVLIGLQGANLGIQKRVNVSNQDSRWPWRRVRQVKRGRKQQRGIGA